MGFRHFVKSQDTRLALDERKAHRFVCVNLEEAQRKIMALTGMLPADIDIALRELTDLTVEYEKSAAESRTRKRLEGLS